MSYITCGSCPGNNTTPGHDVMKADDVIVTPDKINREIRDRILESDSFNVCYESKTKKRESMLSFQKEPINY